jgi:hypothetical protein
VDVQGKKVKRHKRLFKKQDSSAAPVGREVMAREFGVTNDLEDLEGVTSHDCDTTTGYCSIEVKPQVSGQVGMTNRGRVAALCGELALLLWGRVPYCFDSVVPFWLVPHPLPQHTWTHSSSSQCDPCAPTPGAWCPFFATATVLLPSIQAKPGHADADAGEFGGAGVTAAEAGDYDEEDDEMGDFIEHDGPGGSAQHRANLRALAKSARAQGISTEAAQDLLDVFGHDVETKEMLANWYAANEGDGGEAGDEAVRSLLRCRLLASPTVDPTLPVPQGHVFQLSRMSTCL